MKTLLLIMSLTLLVTYHTTAQQFEGIATYKTDRKVDLKMDGEGMDDAMQEQMAAMLRKQFQKEYTLTFNKNESIYEEVESLDAPAPKTAGGISIMVSGGNDVLYRNVATNEYVRQTEIMGKEFLVQDTLPTTEWKLEKETKNIGNYTCFKATHTREVTEKTMTTESDSLMEVTKLKTTTVWYTLDVPVKHGPSEFHSLPGLVLQVEDGDLTILCSKIVLNPKEGIAIEVPKKGKKVNQAEFDEIREKKNAEMMEDNPYLDDFYNSMERWSFNLQIYFLNSRFRQILEIRESGKKVIQDRTIYEDAYIFAPNLHAMGLMTNRDYENYRSLFDLMESVTEGPDLLIYLRSSIPNLVNQIHKRGREYENSISIDYLSRLNERYEAWVHEYDKGNMLIIDVDNLNFVDNPEDLGSVINKIDAELHGLF